MTSSIWETTEGLMTDKNSTEQTLYRLGLAAILTVAAALFLIKWFRIPLAGPLFACPVYSMTGLFCPGCGGTRAFALLLQGKIWQSALCHPLVIYGLTLFSLFMISHTLKIFTRGKIKGFAYRHIYIKIAVAFLILNVLVKNMAWIFWKVNLVEWAAGL
ncbi:MAG: DUF2752 domain-containing protein [Lachnospiraceae bacterium]|nr:DUF2752 domain-containing protein [Lachnospiraceae bacterium]